MSLVLLLIILIVLFGGGGFYWGGPAWGGGLGGILVIILYRPTSDGPAVTDLGDPKSVSKRTKTRCAAPTLERRCFVRSWDSAKVGISLVITWPGAISTPRPSLWSLLGWLFSKGNAISVYRYLRT
jgi:hypothetical protein